MKHDTVMEAWLKGGASAAAKMSIAENPYSAGTMLHATWSKGWRKRAEAEIQQASDACLSGLSRSA